MVDEGGRVDVGRGRVEAGASEVCVSKAAWVTAWSGLEAGGRGSVGKGEKTERGASDTSVPRCLSGLQGSASRCGCAPAG